MALTPETLPPDAATDSPDKGTGWIATAALVGAGLASACCVVPLVLVTLGISGAWIANLTALEPFKPYVAAVTLPQPNLAQRLRWWDTARLVAPALMSAVCHRKRLSARQRQCMAGAQPTVFPE